jgi:acyl carrier protein
MVEIKASQVVRADKVYLTSQEVGLIEIKVIEVIAELLDIETHQIDIYVPLSSFRLDFIEVVILASELSKFLERNISPTLAYDYPNIAALAQYLSQE